MKKLLNKKLTLDLKGDPLPVDRIIVQAQDPNQPAKQAEANLLFNDGCDILHVASELGVTPKVAQQWWNDWQVGLAHSKRRRRFWSRK